MSKDCSNMWFLIFESVASDVDRKSEGFEIIFSADYKVAFVFHMQTNENFQNFVSRKLSILIVSCPCSRSRDGRHWLLLSTKLVGWSTIAVHSVWLVLVFLEQPINRVRDQQPVDAVGHVENGRNTEVVQPNDSTDWRYAKEYDCWQDQLWGFLKIFSR